MYKLILVKVTKLQFLYNEGLWYSAIPSPLYTNIHVCEETQGVPLFHFTREVLKF